MSSRPVGRTAFENLRPTILRQPARTVVSAEAESRLLDLADTPTKKESEDDHLVETASSEPEKQYASSAPLLTRKKRDLLIPVTFRMPQQLKERLEEIAKLHELNQTDLINEAIRLNLQRYPFTK